MSSWEEKFNEIQNEYQSMQNKYDAVQNKYESMQKQYQSVQKEFTEFKINQTSLFSVKSKGINHGKSYFITYIMLI